MRKTSVFKTFSTFLWVGTGVTVLVLSRQLFALPPAQADSRLKDDQALRTKIDKANSDVRNRLHMSSMIEVSEDGSEESEILELYHSGWIVDASVEEVQKAVELAAMTPAPEDDIAARTLSHRASCRFFFNEK